jgi:transcription elongation GreA/GreB family factor
MVVPHPIDRDTDVSYGPIPMTREVFDRLESEVERLLDALPVLHDAAVVARGEDDDATLALPAAWDLQRHQQRIGALRQLLSAAVVVPQDGTVILGSRVVIRDLEESDSYVLVAPGEADPRAGRISFESPLGRALLGCRAGETAAVAAPDGVRSVTIVAIEHAGGLAP